MDCFALLDNTSASAERASTRLYEDFAREHRCTDPLLLDELWADVQRAQAQGLHAVLLADYEWGAKLLRAGHENLPANDPAALRVLLFRQLQTLTREQADAWLARRDEGALQPTPAGAGELHADVDQDTFERAIASIHEAIRAGETYQVNFTYGMSFAAFGSPVALYRRLRARQPVAYGAFIALPPSADHDTMRYVLSCSPELFLRHQRGVLTARPMKGTARREREPEGDSETARQLSLDIKNRAENLMIVDLLRNDLGRIARIGSVKVPELFTIEPYATVFQMTSTVQAEIDATTRFPDVLRALFPCGSITGAPKHHTMQIIAGLEHSPRGLYTGSIGWIDAPDTPQSPRACGDFCLSVAIRTITLAEPKADGLRPGRLHVGAGIVLDSDATDEFDECRLKARFLTGLDPGFTLFETMRVGTREMGIEHGDRHMERLGRSARDLGFAFDAMAVHRALVNGLASLTGSGPWRLRLDLHKDGRTAIRSSPLAPLPPGPVKLLLAQAPLQDVPPALRRHKTSWRNEYDAAIERADAAGAFDTLFFDAQGFLTEGARSSVFVRLSDDTWATPPLAAGVLPGVMRDVLINDPAWPTWQAQERWLTREQLLAAHDIIVCNALRGALVARVAP